MENEEKQEISDRRKNLGRITSVDFEEKQKLSDACKKSRRLASVEITENQELSDAHKKLASPVAQKRLDIYRELVV